MMTNDAVYRLSEVIKELSSIVPAGLTVPEKYCLDLVPESGRRSVLDIGVGAGRTTRSLSKMFQSYIGIDYSESMIAEARKLHPGIDLRVMDARRLDVSQWFDCVVFSYNGIDYVDYDGRQLILGQIAKVLRPGGYFIYSTHNLHWKRSVTFLKHLLVKELLSPWPRLCPMGQLFAARLLNFWRQRVDHSHAYACINDSAAGFRLLTIHVDICRESETLRNHGFDVVAIIGNTKQTAVYDASDAWVYIVANRL
jgi:SAM-dependent methyltransferase